MTNPRNRITLQQAEAILKRPCPHAYRTRPDYCRACSNHVAQLRMSDKRAADLNAWLVSQGKAPIEYTPEAAPPPNLLDLA